MKKSIIILVMLIVLVLFSLLFNGCTQKTSSQQNQEVEEDWTTESW
ncbi:MAG: hypothetical protein M1326_03675 [Cyanobacteria bacterium]|nr:hypothetical protein [Cyanobacteriota bacterium]